MTTITEDYCDFETAQLLKEKGFDVPCLAHWFIGTNKHFVISTTPQNWNEVKTDLSWLSCPTLQMAMKWLREVHELYIEVSLSCDREDKNAKIFDASIFNLQNQRYKKLGNIQGYEQACEVAIRYCLEKLI
jgi:hypothetical protein